MASLILFCGGEKIYGEKNPKPLMSYNDKTLIVEYLNRIQTSSFESIVLLVENQDYKNFEFIATFKNLKILSVEDKSSTLQKVRKMLNENYDDIHENIFFSYPDIIYEQEIFIHTFDSSLNLKITPLKSRFPEIIRDRFSENIKGITIFDSPVPANPTFIFAGVAAIKKDILKNQLKDFILRSEADGNFEVDFFQFMIDQNLAKYQIYSGKWKTIDSKKDFLQNL